MEAPWREDRRLVKVRGVLLEIGACVGDRGIRRAEAFNRMRDACANLEESLLAAEGSLYIPFDSHMIFGVVGLFRPEGNLQVRREVFPPGACKGVQLSREQIEPVVAIGVRPVPRACRVVASL